MLDWIVMGNKEIDHITFQNLSKQAFIQFALCEYTVANKNSSTDKKYS